MDRGSCRRFTILVLSLCLVFAVSPGAFGAGKDRKTLILRGRITDNGGWPLAGAKVRARAVPQDAQRGRATTDDAGQFTLQIPLGSPADLAGNPTSLRVSAELRGWRMALPGGESELGLDLRVVSGADGITRCEVRSNHPAVGATLVRMLTADGEVTQVANVSFLATQGEAAGTQPAGELPLVDRVPLAGIHVPPPAAKKIEAPKDTTRMKPAPPVTSASPPPAPAKPIVNSAPPVSTPPRTPAPTPLRTGAPTPVAPINPPAQTPLSRDASRPANSNVAAPPRDSARSAAEAELLRRAVQRDSARRAAEAEMAARAARFGAGRRTGADSVAFAERERARRAGIRREAEDAARRVAEAQAARHAAEQDSIRRAAADEKTRQDAGKGSARKAAAAEVARRNAERDSIRRAEADAAVRLKADRDAARLAAAAETARRATQQDSMRRMMSAQAMRRGTAQDSARRAAQAEAARRAAAQDWERHLAATETIRRTAVQDSSRREAEDANRRAAMQETARRAAEAEAARRAAAEERTRRTAEQEASRRAAMMEAERRAAELRQQRAPARVPAPRDTTPAKAPSAATPDSSSSQVRPKPDGEPRVRTAPLVIRASEPPATKPGEPCTCRIEGTIEVDSDKPLPKRARVVISLVPYPNIHDTVELFMGSPRAFRLPPAPCGAQRLRLVNQGSMRFDVVSTEAMNGFQCEPGARHQFRIVLKPHR